MGLAELKSDVGWVVFLSQDSRGGFLFFFFFFLPHPASRGHLHSSAHGPLPLTSKPATLHLSDHSSPVTSPSDQHRKGSPLFRTRVMRLGPPK